MAGLLLMSVTACSDVDEAASAGERIGPARTSKAVHDRIDEMEAAKKARRDRTDSLRRSILEGQEP